MNVGRRFKWPDDYFRGDWSIKYQKTDVINGDNYYQTGVRNQFSIRQIISRSTIFDPLFPVSGTKSLKFYRAFREVLSFPGIPNLLKQLLKQKTYTPLFKSQNWFVLSGLIFFGYLNPFGKDKYLPPTEYFYMGGNGLTYNTIALRGYDDRNVGPKNSKSESDRR